jgi:ABC-type multidrug transport system ATPase subunit
MMIAATGLVKRYSRTLALSDVAHRRISTCSRGMLQRLALATSLLDSPRLLIWDEPMGGLDPAWQKSVHAMVRNLARTVR